MSRKKRKRRKKAALVLCQGNLYTKNQFSIETSKKSSVGIS